jgi:hypothetical protein
MGLELGTFCMLAHHASHYTTASLEIRCGAPLERLKTRNRSQSRTESVAYSFIRSVRPVYTMVNGASAQSL